MDNIVYYPCPNSLAMVEALPYFESRSLILAPNIRQGKRFCSGVVCCMGSAVYLAGRHLKKSRKLVLRSAFLSPKAVQLLLKLYIKRQISSRADLVNTVK